MTKNTLTVTVKDRAIVSNPDFKQHVFFIYTNDGKIYATHSIRLWFMLPKGSSHRIVVDDGYLASVFNESDGTIVSVIE